MNKKVQKPLTEEEKAEKALLKAQRKAEFEAKYKKEQENKKKSADEKGAKTKAELKAERRAKQEAQRAAKSGQSNPIPGQSSVATVAKTVPPPQPKQQQQQQKSSSPKKSTSEQTSARQKTNKPKIQAKNKDKDGTLKKQDSIISNKELPDRILSHLPKKASQLSKLSTESIPEDVIQIGFRINANTIADPTARCVAMLMAFHNVVKNYQPEKDIKRELQDLLFEDCHNFLNKCRPLCISMINAMKHLKSIFAKTSSELKDNELRESVCKAIKTFIEEEIICSRKAISDNALIKIFSNETNQTILTLGCSTIMQKIFLDAHRKKIQFKVVVVDSRPRFEGRRMVQFLTQHKIPCTYILINAVLYVMKEVNKVMLEAHSVLCNGYVMSTIGSSQIALVAQAYNVPVVVCCETFKYSDRAYTDCFTHNELGDSAESFFGHDSSSSNHGQNSSVENSSSSPIVGPSNLTFLDLFYDLTPREFISAVITEKGLLPCTSVPAILRFRETIK